MHYQTRFMDHQEESVVLEDWDLVQELTEDPLVISTKMEDQWEALAAVKVCQA